MSRDRSTWQVLTGEAFSATVDGSITVAIGYAADDPYAVHLIISADGRDASCWVFARDLLLHGLTGQAGSGDVLVGSAVGAGVVSIILRNGRDMLAIELPRTPLCRFAADMLAIVPRGREGGYVDLDAELRTLLA